jgi:hypothetical protein
MDKHTSTPDLILKAEDIQWIPFTLPGWTGGTTAAFPNMDVEKAPFIAMAKLEPDAYIQRHYHHDYSPSAPFGGFKLSGYCREHAIESFESYTQYKTIWTDLYE